MKQWCIKHKKLLITLAILICLYILIPVMALQAPPFHLFHLDADRVTAIEIDHNGEIVRYEAPEEIQPLVAQLNSTRFSYWYMMLPMSGSDYTLAIEHGGKRDIYEVGPTHIQPGTWMIYRADFSFVSTDVIPY